MSDSVLGYEDLSKSEEDLLIDLAKSRASTIAWMKSYDAAVADLTEADEKNASLSLENQELRQQVEDLKGEVAYLASRVESYDDAEMRSWHDNVRTTDTIQVHPSIGGFIGDFDASNWNEYGDEDGGTVYVV